MCECAGGRPLTLAAFEARMAQVPDLELGWQYWNWLLPETAPGYFVWQLMLALEALRSGSPAEPIDGRREPREACGGLEA